MTHGRDFREAAIAYKQKGHTLKQVCETFKINPQTYYNWKNQKQKTGSLQPKKHGPRKRKINNQKLEQHLKEHPRCLPQRNRRTIQLHPTRHLQKTKNPKNHT